jgi:hypothetical protein
MAALQLIWLALIVLTGASTKYQTILVVAILSVIATLFVIFLPTSVIEKTYYLKDWLFRSESGPFPGTAISSQIARLSSLTVIKM